jgi:PrgI family protein
MRARVPLDVDLEDRILYGLTPIRLAYAVLAGLGAMAIWSASALPTPVRIPLVIVVLGAGAALAWGTFRGRPADEWMLDSALFVWSAVRLRWDWPVRLR